MKKFFSKTHVFHEGHYWKSVDTAKGIGMCVPKVVGLKTDALVECMTNFAALRASYSFTYEKCTVWSSIEIISTVSELFGETHLVHNLSGLEHQNIWFCFFLFIFFFFT